MVLKDKRIVVTVAKETIERKDVVETQKYAANIKKTLLNRGLIVDIIGIEKVDFTNEKIIRDKINVCNPACVFNLFEGFSDEPQKEAEFVALLEKENIPFTGNCSRTLSLCLNKTKTKEVLQSRNLPVPQSVLVTADTTVDVEKKDFSFPLFIKPNSEDASLGIDESSLLNDKSNISQILTEKLSRFSGGVLVEEFIPGNEYNVGLLGKYPYEVLGASVIDYSLYSDLLPFLTYSSKWDKKSKEYKKIMPVVEKNIDTVLRKKIVELSQEAGAALGCSNYFRVDLRMRGDELFILDVNPNPDIDSDSGFARQALAKGYEYEQVLERILLDAIGSHKERNA